MEREPHRLRKKPNFIVITVMIVISWHLQDFLYDGPSPTAVVIVMLTVIYRHAQFPLPIGFSYSITVIRVFCS